MKKILILISSLNTGGAERQAIEDANMLTDDFQVFIFTFTYGPMCELVNEKVRLIQNDRKSFLKTTKYLLQIIREHQIDLLHAHLYAPMIFSSVCGFLSRKPVIWNLHSHAFENSIQARLLHKLTSKLSSVKKILFPSKELLNYYNLEGYAFSSFKTIIAHNSGQVFSHQVKKGNRLENNKVTIGFIGRLVELKRVEYLLELAQFLKHEGISEFIIVIVGDGPQFSKLVALSSAKGLENEISFQGFQSDTIKYYQSFDIFTLPSREEVLSLSLIDAGLSGLPSVAFWVGGNSEIVIDGATGFLVATKNDFFNKTKELIINSALRVKIGKSARELCYKKFSLETRRLFLNRIYEQYI